MTTTSKRWTQGVVASVLTCLAVMVSAAAPTQAGTSNTAKRIAVEHVFAGTATTADLAMIRTDPVLAAQVPDPNGVTQGVTSSPDNRRNRGITLMASGSGNLGIGNGRWLNVYLTQRSLTGSVIFTWHQYTSINNNGTNVTGVVSRYDYLSQSSSVVSLAGLVANSQSATPIRNYTSLMQRRINYCELKVGCYASVYPYASISIWGGGNYSWSGAVA